MNFGILFDKDILIYKMKYRKPHNSPPLAYRADQKKSRGGLIQELEYYIMLKNFLNFVNKICFNISIIKK